MNIYSSVYSLVPQLIINEKTWATHGTCISSFLPEFKTKLFLVFLLPIRTKFYSSKHTLYLLTEVVPFHDEAHFFHVVIKWRSETLKTYPDFTKIRLICLSRIKLHLLLAASLHKRIKLCSMALWKICTRQGAMSSSFPGTSTTSKEFCKKYVVISPPKLDNRRPDYSGSISQPQQDML